MKHRIGFLVLSLVIGLSRPQAAWAATFEALLLGSNEVPGPGMPDGSALARVVVDGTQVTISIDLRGFGELTAVHIHKGKAGVAGALAADLPLSFPPDGCLPRSSAATPSFSGSLSARLAAKIVANPQDYYVHVHTKSFPAGACRGQLNPRLQTESSRTAVPPSGGPMAVQIRSPRALLPVDCRAARQIALAETAPRPAAQQTSLGTAQTITFAVPPPMTYGDPDFRVEASASSGLPVALTAWGDCTINGSYLHVLAAGVCWMEAQQPGGSSFAAAPSVDLQFSIAKADQTISFLGFPDVGDLPAGFVITLSGRASSGLPVDITARGACMFSRVTSTLSGLGAGSCTVTAQQPGDTNFNPAPSVTQTFPIITVPELD